MKCLDQNNYNKAACSAYFEAYKGICVYPVHGTPVPNLCFPSLRVQKSMGKHLLLTQPQDAPNLIVPTDGAAEEGPPRRQGCPCIVRTSFIQRWLFKQGLSISSTGHEFCHRDRTVH